MAWIPKQPKEESLFKLLNEIGDIKTHCLACQLAPYSAVREYITNTATRSKLVLSCSAHFNTVLSFILVFQDPINRGKNPPFEDVTPHDKDGSPYHIHNIGLRVYGRTVRIRLATNKPITANEWSDSPVTTSRDKLHQFSQDAIAALVAEKSSGPDSDLIVERLSNLPLRANAGVPLSGSNQTLALASGLAQMDIAFEALENAYAKLQLFGPEGMSPRVNLSVLQRASRLRSSARAIAKLVQDVPQLGMGVAAGNGIMGTGEATSEVCHQENSFVNGEAIPYLQESTKEVLAPEEQAHIGKTTEWLHKL
jgi:hypothetical protein